MEMISRKKFFQFLIFPKERWDLLLGKEGQQFCQLSGLASNNLSLSLGLVNTCFLLKWLFVTLACLFKVPQSCTCVGRVSSGKMITAQFPWIPNFWFLCLHSPGKSILFYFILNCNNNKNEISVNLLWHIHSCTFTLLLKRISV